MSSIQRAIISIVMVIIILSTTIPLSKESALILLQTVPTHIRVKDIREKIEMINGVQAIHEFHVWQLAGNRVVASAHIRVSNLQEYIPLSEKIKNLFHNKGIHSTTIQPFQRKTDYIPLEIACWHMVPTRTVIPTRVVHNLKKHHRLKQKLPALDPMEHRCQMK